jgi:hypothetical protein
MTDTVDKNPFDFSPEFEQWLEAHTIEMKGIDGRPRKFFVSPKTGKVTEMITRHHTLLEAARLWELTRDDV